MAIPPPRPLSAVHLFTTPPAGEDEGLRRDAPSRIGVENGAFEPGPPSPPRVQVSDAAPASTFEVPHISSGHLGVPRPEVADAPRQQTTPTHSGPIARQVGGEQSLQQNKHRSESEVRLESRRLSKEIQSTNALIPQHVSETSAGGTSRIRRCSHKSAHGRQEYRHSRCFQGHRNHNNHSRSSRSSSNYGNNNCSASNIASTSDDRNKNSPPKSSASNPVVLLPQRPSEHSITSRVGGENGDNSNHSSSGNGRVGTTVAIVHEPDKRDDRSYTCAVQSNIAGQNNEKSVPSGIRSSWTQDSNGRKREEATWRRRQTDPSGETIRNYSYHRDYQEALSSLLWQPYECRDQSPQANTISGSIVDDGDVSMWLYPQLSRATRDSNVNVPYGNRLSDPSHLSSSSSTSSMSSGSSSVALGVAAMVEEGCIWRISDNDASSSSLKALLLSASSSKDDGLSWGDLTTSHSRYSGLSAPGDAAIHQRTGNSACSADDPHRGREPRQHQRAVEDDAMVSDLQKRWSGESQGALVSAHEDCSLCCCQQFTQLECGRRTERLASGCSLCGDVQGPAAMLVNVDCPVDTRGVSGSRPCREETQALVVSSSVATLVSSAGVTSNSVGDCGVSVVSCYRAVPVLVSSVPTIPCLNNVSNVQIVQASTTPPRTTSSTSAGIIASGRTFTSTEAQTDDVSVPVDASAASPARSIVNASSQISNNREQRRRERRERRHQRRLNSAGEGMWQGQAPLPHPGERLPDLLNSHLPPPYSTLPLALSPVPVPPPQVPAPPPPPPVSPPPHPGSMRFPFQITPAGRRRSRRSQHYTPEEEPKSCCGVVVTQTVSIRWFIVMIAFVGICCAVVGTVLGAMKASGREHLTVSLLMIGVGIVLITVSGVAWRLTAHDAPTCRMMLGLGGGEDGSAEPNRRFVPRLPPSYGRPHHPYAAMMYPEFQYRPPPPSYQASMQEYRLRLLLLDRHSGTGGPTHTVSPPPTYRSHAGSTLRAPLGLRRGDQCQSDYSRPPSYRSRTSSTRPTLDPSGHSASEHSRDPSLSLSEPGGGSAVVNVISVMGDPRTDRLDNIKLAPPGPDDVSLRMPLNKSGGMKDPGNLVTIVQTSSEPSPVIVTVSGSTTTIGGSTSNQHGNDTEMEILAHL